MESELGADAAPAPAAALTSVTTLKRRAEFLRVRGGIRAETRAFLIEGKPRPAATTVETSHEGGPSITDEGSRFGYTVTKRLGNAVTRNRIRRRLREAVRKVAPAAARTNFDYVLVARPAALKHDFADLCRDLENALQRVHRPASERARDTGDDRRGRRAPAKV